MHDVTTSRHTSQGQTVPAIPTDLSSKMSSIEIAELTGKRHDNVMRDIKTLIKQEAINGLNFEETFREVSGPKNSTRKSPMYLLDFRATMVLVTGYDARRRAAVIDRWIALESGAAEPDPALVAAARDEALTGAAMVAESITKNSLPGRLKVEMAVEAMKELFDSDPLVLACQAGGENDCSSHPAGLLERPGGHNLYGGFCLLKTTFRDGAQRVILAEDCLIFFRHDCLELFPEKGSFVIEDELYGVFRGWFERAFAHRAPAREALFDAVIVHGQESMRLTVAGVRIITGISLKKEVAR